MPTDIDAYIANITTFYAALTSTLFPTNRSAYCCAEYTALHASKYATFDTTFHDTNKSTEQRTYSTHFPAE